MTKKRKFFIRNEHHLVENEHLGIEGTEAIEVPLRRVHHNHTGFSYFLNDPLVSLALTSFALIALLLAILEFGQSVH